MTSLAVSVLASDIDVGEAAADIVLAAHQQATAERRAFVLGCPAGRTPRSTYAALARRVAAAQVDLSNTRIVMMDEYVEHSTGDWRWCPSHAHYSCRGFAERELRSVINAGLPVSKQIPAHAVHTPEPERPEEYERLIEALGGIDVFLLATGASDGHVAFNPPGTSLGSVTRVVELAPTTRSDNVGTFPRFSSGDEVPRHGVSVGLGTIVRLSRRTLLLICGPSKRASFRRVMSSGGFDASWPATVIWTCVHGEVLADEAAAGKRKDKRYA
ncbi:glucosamine-6-phosphate deaminase [Povalibacter uvarum]|uniref:Glucosamine-6-phosphate deaminase n=1 Tax=Povalibacter uvarum TaxID=732238 RepID=A0A841HQ22_9GAMM|nr:6-phosphogluconolactonase [Povalibacter uvarum]MBB6095441.1 glucosamine-6-phosphate deaminase [Povalibacter uvarum]